MALQHFSHGNNILAQSIRFYPSVFAHALESIELKSYSNTVSDVLQIEDSQTRTTVDGAEITICRGTYPLCHCRGEYQFRYFSNSGILECSGLLRNDSNQATPPIRGPFSAHFIFDAEALGNLKMTSLFGGRFTSTEYPPRAYALHRHDGIFSMSSASTGFSTDYDAPYIMVSDTKEENSLLSLMEWPGRWSLYFCEFLDSNDQRKKLNLAWQQSESSFCIPPKQSVQVPACIIVFGKGDTAECGNGLRHHFATKMRPALNGRKDYLPPVFYNHFYAWNNQFNEEDMKREARFYARVGCEYFVIDGGWFPKTFRDGIGNYDAPDLQKFPSGIRDFSDFIHDLGMKFGLWFELEFAMKDSEWVQQVPQYYLSAGRRIDPVTALPYKELMFRMDLPEARDWLLEKLTKKIRDWRIDWVRLDCNNSHGNFWDEAETSDNFGLFANRYCVGLNYFLNELTRRCPDLHIENCAGGGRRMDLGILRNSHSAWMSDLAANPHSVRRFQVNLNRFLPGVSNSVYMAPQKTGDGEITFGTEKFRWENVLSRFAGPLGETQKSIQFSSQGTEQLKQSIAVYKQIRHYLLKDFYSSFDPKSLDEWDGWQFHDPETDSGIFAVFRCQSAENEKSLLLRGLSAECDYQVIPLIGDVSASAVFLLHDGNLINILLKNQHDCELYTYHRKEDK